MTPDLLTPAEPAVWTPAEREAWALDGEILPSEWQDRHRVLTEKMGAAEPGRMRTDRLPYTRGVLDAWVKAEVEDVTCVFATQIGKTEMEITLFGYIVDQRPGNILFAMPRREDVTETIRDRLIPAFEACDAVAHHLTGVVDDVSQKRVAFDRCILHAGWAKSDASLKSKPLPYYFGDELSEWEQDKDELCVKRTGTHWNRKHFRVSTPDLDTDTIVLRWDDSLQHHFYVPCPFCLGYQVLVFPRIKWPADERDGNRIDTLNLAWYECEHCGGEIRDAHKREMLLGGVWIPDVAAENFLSLYGGRLAAALRGRRRGELLGGRTADDVARLLDPDGEIGWEYPSSNHWGFQLAGWYAPWDSRRFSRAAREFLEAKDYPVRLQVFKNTTQAEPWIEVAQEVKDDALDRLVIHVPKGIVPADVQVLTAGGDVHGDTRPIYGGILGWSAEDRVHLVYEDVFESLDELGEALLGRSWPVAGARRVLRVQMLFVDARYRQSEVYSFARQWPETCRPIMGQDAARTRAKWVVRYVDLHPHTGRAMKAGLKRVDVTVDPFKREVIRHLVADPDGPGAMTLHEDVSPAYRKQVTGEKLVRERDKRTGQERHVWKVTGENHHLDWTVYAFAAADYCRARQLAPLPAGVEPGEARGKVRMSDKLRNRR